MVKKYKRTSNSHGIIRMADGATFEESIDNLDYRNFLVDYKRDPSCLEEGDALPSARRLVPKSTILARLTEDQVKAIMSILSPKQKERWRAADKPAVYFDDVETIAALEAVGADPNVVLAE